MGLSNYIPSSRIAQSGVCTSSTRPATPFEGQMIYETDTDKVLVWNGSAWYANWNASWGYIAEATLSSNIGYITSGQDILSITFTSVANRRYRYTASGLLTFDASGNFSSLFVNSSNTALREYFGFSAGAGVYQQGFFDYTETISTSGSVTRKVRHQSTGPGVYYYGSATRDQVAWKIRVEDIGPA